MRFDGKNGEVRAKSIIRKSSIRDELAASKSIWTFTSGSSMEPLLYDHKTLVKLEPIAGAKLRRGALPVVMRDDGKYVIHRLIGKRNGLYVTRGDNCLTSEIVRPDQVLGVVTEIERSGKIIRVASFSYRLYAWLWMIAFPLRKLVRKGKGAIRRALTDQFKWKSK